MSERSEDHLVITAREDAFAKQFPNISAEEMRCKCPDVMCALPTHDTEFRAWCYELQHLRNVLQFPFHFTSFYRCPAYNDQIYIDRALAAGEEPKLGEHLDGPHTIGAADLRISFERMYQLVAEATARGMGVGIKQHGSPGLRFIHLDNLGSRLWTY